MTVLRTLLEITIYSAVLLGAVMLFRAVFKKHASPAMLYAAWFVLIARLLMPVTIGGISLIVIPAPPPATVAQLVDMSSQTGGKTETIVFPQTPAADLEETTAFQGTVEVPEVNTESMTADVHRETPWKWSWETALLALWISGGIIVMLNAAVASVRLGRRLSKAPALPDGWRDTAERIKQELGIRGHVRFVMLRDFASPALSASLRPTVVIPFELFWEEDRRLIEFALRHELTHVKRRDHLVCLLLMLLKAVYWFNPAVWVASRQMKLDMETACDSMVVKSMDSGTKKQYAATILGMYAKAQPRFVLGMALGHTRQTAERRVRGIFMRSRSSRRTTAAALILAAMLVMACFTTACQPVTEAGSEVVDVTPVSSNVNAVAEPVSAEEPDLGYTFADTGFLKDIVNIMLIGVDHAVERDTWEGKEAFHADVMIVLSVNKATGAVNMISLPRDTYAQIPGVDGIYKLNASIDCGGGWPTEAGFQKVMEAAEWMLGGIPVDYYYAVDMNAVKGLVDAVGGVQNFDVEMDFKMQGRAYTKGVQDMDGQAVLDYLRVRKGVEEAGDLNRINRQKKMLVAIFHKIQQNGLLTSIPQLLDAFEGNLYTNTNLAQTTALTAFASSVDPASIGMYSMDGHYENIFNWNFVITDQEKRVELINQIYGVEMPQYEDYPSNADGTAWGYKLPGVFTDGEVVKTDTTYQSENINISIKKVNQKDITYYVSDIYIRNLECLQTAFADDKFGATAPTDEIARSKGAILAISGDFCTKNEGVVVRNGIMYRDKMHDSDLLALNYDGTMQTFSPEEFDLAKTEAEGVWQVWTFGPMLLKDGQPMTEFNSSSTVIKANPRSAVGYYEPGHYCFVLVDGRQPGYSIGMTMQEMSQLFYDMGCKVAYNLDGGKSAEMAFMGELVNQPYEGGRATSDILYIADN